MNIYQEYNPSIKIYNEVETQTESVDLISCVNEEKKKLITDDKNTETISDELKAIHICAEIEKFNQEIWDNEKRNNYLKNVIKNKQKILWKTCTHEWEKDHNVAFDDHIKYFCKKCSLWRNRYMYQ